MNNHKRPIIISMLAQLILIVYSTGQQVPSALRYDNVSTSELFQNMLGAVDTTEIIQTKNVLITRMERAPSAELNEFIVTIEDAYLAAPFEPRTLRFATDILPPNKAVEWLLEQDLLDYTELNGVLAFLEALGGIKLEAVPQYHDQLASYLEEMYIAVVQHNLRYHHDLNGEFIRFLWQCGDKGKEILQRYPHLSRIWMRTTPALVEAYLADPESSTGRQALSTLVDRMPNLDVPTQTMVHNRISVLLQSDDASNRRHGASLAARTRDPQYLPALNDLAQNDPHLSIAHTSDGHQLHQEYRYCVREDAANAIHEIKNATDPIYRRKISLERHITDLERQRQRAQENLAAGIDPEISQVRLHAANEKLEQAHAELEALQNQPTTP